MSSQEQEKQKAEALTTIQRVEAFLEEWRGNFRPEVEGHSSLIYSFNGKDLDWRDLALILAAAKGEVVKGHPGRRLYIEMAEDAVANYRIANSRQLGIIGRLHRQIMYIHGVLANDARPEHKLRDIAEELTHGGNLP